MSEAAANVELVRGAYQSWAERGVEGLVEVMHTDQVLVLATLSVRGRDSGAEFTIPVGHLLTIRDGKVIRFEVFPERDDAIAAAGLDSAG